MATKIASKIEEVNNTGIADVRYETIFDILARNICNAIRFVFRKWSQLILTHKFLLRKETEFVTQFGSHLILLIGSNMASLSNCSHVAAQTCPPCKSNMLKSTNIESLPDDVIFEILLRVPAQHLYDSTRLVCREWHNTIDTRNFKNSHIQQSNSGLVAVDLYFDKQYFVLMQNGRIEISEWSYDFSHNVVSSCNALVLEIHQNSKGPYITNPVTKQHFALPPFLLRKATTYKVSSCTWFALVYADSSRTYKVVSISDLECAIISVGVDIDWGRRVSTQHLSFKGKELLEGSPITTPGFVHWALDDCLECVLTMNVESEIIRQIPGPCLRDDVKSLWCRYLPKGSYLCLLIGRDKISWEWEVWEMKPETGEWTRKPNIELEPQMVLEHLSFKWCSNICSASPLLKPVGWSNSGEVLFFCVCLRSHHVHSGIFVAYNFSTQEIDSCELRISCISPLFLDHRSSLVWLD